MLSSKYLKKKSYKGGRGYRARMAARRGGRARRALKAGWRVMTADSYAGLEFKFLDCAWNSVAINISTDGSSGEVQPSSGCTGAISVPAQGDGDSNRDGRKYTLTSVWLSGVVLTSPSSDAADTTETLGFWFALVLDTQANGATIVSENAFINPSSQAAAMMPQPLRNLANSKRYKVLARRYVKPNGVYAFNDAAATGSLSTQINPTITLNWSGKIKVTCTGTTADVASVSDNAIHLVAFAGDSTFTPTFTGKSRVRFVG